MAEGAALTRQGVDRVTGGVVGGMRTATRVAQQTGEVLAAVGDGAGAIFAQADLVS